MTLTVASAAFGVGQPMPPRYTATAENWSPPLTWSRPPEGTKTIAVLCEDPDAPRGLWVHWVLYNLPPTTRALPEHVPTAALLPDQARQGVNGSGTTGYSGPYPPPGTPHRYFFKVVALDTVLELPAKTTRAQLLEAVAGHILAEGETYGTFQR